MRYWAIILACFCSFLHGATPDAGIGGVGIAGAGFSASITGSYFLDPLPVSNRIDYATIAGANERIANTVWTNLPASANYTEINFAISNCWRHASNGIVLLTNSTFVLTDRIKMRPGVHLSTIHGTNTLLILTNQIWLGNNLDNGTVATAAIVTGAWKGSSNVTAASAVNCTPGQYIVVTATNDWSFVHPYGYEGGSATIWYGDGGSTVSDVNRGQVSRLVSVSNGTNLVINPALQSDFTNTPGSLQWRQDTFSDVLPMVGYASIRNMAIQCPTNAEGIEVHGAYDSFISNVVFRVPNQGSGSYSAINIAGAVNITVQHSHCEGATPQTSFVNVRENAGGIRVENNTGNWVYQFVVTASRGGNNYFGYNYNHQVTNGTSAMIDEFLSHGSHKQFQLWEGNRGYGLRFDNIHGSSSSQIAFRNYMVGEVTGYSTFGWGSFWNDSWNYHNHWVGNVGGYAGMTAYVYEQESPTAVDKAIFSWGYHGYSTSPTTGTLSKATAVIHGNVTFESGVAVTNWATGYSRTLTNSLVYASRPSWYGTNLAWPAYGPDVAGGHTNMIPAQWRYLYGTNSF